MVKIKFFVPTSINLSRKQYFVIAGLLLILLSFFGLVAFKYLRLRNDYGRILLLLDSGGGDSEASGIDDTVNGRHSAQKYMEGVFQDPKLVEITESLGIHKNNIQGLEMRIVDRATTGTLPDGTEPTIDPAGVFWPGIYEDHKWGDVSRAPKIEVESHLSGEELRRVVAHEFLHHMYSVWWNKDTARWYDQELIIFYINNKSIRNTLSAYVSEGRLGLTEIYAYACTEYSDRVLGSDLAQICSNWFDRSKLSYIY